MNQESKESLAILAYLYIEHFKYEKAYNLLIALNAYFPNDSDISRALAYACLKIGDFQSSLRHAEASIKKGIPQNKLAASTLIKAKALWGLGKEEAAKHTLATLRQLQKE